MITKDNIRLLRQLAELKDSALRCHFAASMSPKTINHVRNIWISLQSFFAKTNRELRVPRLLVSRRRADLFWCKPSYDVTISIAESEATIFLTDLTALPGFCRDSWSLNLENGLDDSLVWALYPFADLCSECS